MGIIAKQSVQNSLSTYLGFIIGGIYTVLLVPKVFEHNPEEWGLARLLISIAMVMIPWMQFSIPNTIIKFYSKFQKENIGNFIFFIYFWLIIINVFSVFFIVFFKDLFISEKTNTLLIENYVLIIPIILGNILFEVFAAFSRVNLNSVLPSFLKEVIYRLFVLIIILAFSYNKLDYNSFLVLYSFSYVLIFVIIIVKHIFSYKQKIIIDFKFLFSDQIKHVYKYAFFILLSTGAAMITLNIDNLMINKYLSLPDIAIYSVWFFLATTLSVPLRSITGIAAPIISKCFTNNDISTIKTIYKKSSITPLIISTFIFFILWLNVDLIKMYFGNTFGQNEKILLYISIGNLFNVAAGVNGTIITLSKYYKIDIVFQVLLVGLVIITNVIFIPIFQIEGVAMATALSLILINVARLIFVFVRLNMHPFSKKYTLFVLFVVVLFIISFFIKSSEGIIDNIIYTTLFSCLYGAIVYFLKISRDLNLSFGKIVSFIWK